MSIHFKEWVFNKWNMKEFCPKCPPVPPCPPCPPCTRPHKDDPPPPPPPPPVTIRQRIGTSAYALVHYPAEEISEFFRKSREAGGTATEAFFIFTWDSGWRWQPYVIVGDYEKFGQKFPKFDLDFWYNAAWAKWEFIFREAKKNDHSLVLRLLDFCSIKDDMEEARLCYRACHQRLDHPEGDPERLTGGLWGVPIRNYYRAMILKILELQKSTGVDLYLSLWNEADVVDAPDDWKDTALVAQYKWFSDLMKERSFPADHIIINTSRAFAELQKLGYTMEIHGCQSDLTMKLMFNSLAGVNFVPNGDGPDTNAKGRAGHNGYREPSPQQGYEMGRLLVKNKCNMYMFFNRSIEPTKISDLKLAQFDVLVELRRGILDAERENT